MKDARKKGKEKVSCIAKLDAEFVLQRQRDMIDCGTSKSERKMFLLGVISAGIVNTKFTNCSKRKSRKKRTKSRSAYYIERDQVCRETFQYVHQ